jgi:hypothetical protein
MVLSCGELQSTERQTYHREKPVKKGRHRRFEEARAMKRSQDVDFDALLDSLQTDDDGSDDPGDGDDPDDLWDDED